MIAYSIVITAFLMCALVALVYEHLGRVRAQEAGEECMKALQEAGYTPQGEDVLL